MNAHNPRKQSPNLSENKQKKTQATENSILTKRKNNYDNRSNLYRFNETKNKIIQQLPNLFIPEEDLSNFNSIISKFTIDNTNFLKVWDNFTDSISNYLSESIALRCSTYINEQINDCRNLVNELYNRLNSDHRQINKKNAAIYKNIQSDLDNLYSKLNQQGNGKIRIISESSNLFDQFINALQSNYLSFFQYALSDQKTMNIFLKSTLKPICNIINCSNSILNLEDIQRNFITQLERATTTFIKIFNTQYPSPKKRHRSSQIPVFSNSLKPDHLTKPTNTVSKIPTIKKRSTSLSSPLSQRPLRRYNSTHNENKNEGSNIKPNLRHRKSETSIISLPDFSQKKFLPKVTKSAKNDQNTKNKKNSKSDNEDEQRNSLDTHMHSDDMYHISNGKLSDSGSETTNVPIKPKPFKISQSRYDQLNKKFNNSPTKMASTSNSILLHNNDRSLLRKSSKSNQLNLSMNLNTNLNSLNSLSSQIKTKRDEETKLVKTIENLSHKNDKLKEQHKFLKQRIEKDKNVTQINNLKTEIESLRLTLNDSQYNSDEMSINVEFLRDLIEILNASIQSLEEECEQALRIKSGIEAEDETANFDNPNLKRSCESLKIKVDRLQSQINENNNQREILISFILHSSSASSSNNQSFNDSDDSYDSKKSDRDYSSSSFNKSNHLKQKKILNKQRSHIQKVITKKSKIQSPQKSSNDISLSNEELRDAFYRLQVTSQVACCANKNLLSLFEQMSVLPNPTEKKSALSFLKSTNNSDFNGLRKLTRNIEKLEANVKKVRQSSSFSSLYNMFYSMKLNAVRMNDEIVDIKKKNKRLINEISRLSLIQSKLSDQNNENNNSNMKRKSFDLYEQLKEKSRELLLKYFAIQKNLTDDLDTAEKYKIDMQLDDIQEQYTTVMMEIDRIGDTKIQEKLHNKRKIKIRGRKEVPKLLDVLENASKFNLEAEKKAVSLEQKVNSTFSSLLKSISQNSDDEDDNDNQYLFRHKFDNDEESVTKLAEVIIECRKVSEILSVIKERTNQFLNTIQKNNPSQVKEAETLKKLIDEVKSLIKKGGSAAQTKLRIVNLKKEIQSYSNIS